MALANLTLANTNLFGSGTVAVQGLTAGSAVTLTSNPENAFFFDGANLIYKLSSAMPRVLHPTLVENIGDEYLTTVFTVNAVGAFPAGPPAFPGLTSGVIDGVGGDPVARRILRTGDGVTASPYLGCVASGGRINTAFSGSGTACLSVAAYRATSPITRPRVVHCNWRVSGGTQAEEASQAANTCRDWIEYPIGVTLSSPVEGVAPAGGNVVNDMGDILIPAGAQFRVWTYRTGTLQPITPRGNIASLSSMVTHGGQGVSQPVLGGSVPGAAANFGYYPLVIDSTTNRSVLLLGDSHEYGQGETLGADGLIGIVERYYGYRSAWFNVGAASDSLAGFLTSNTRRVALAAYFSDVSLGHAGNDLTSGVSAATIVSGLKSAAGLFPGKLLTTGTELPKTTSTDTWATAANQTVNASVEPNRLLVNRFKRSGELFPYYVDFEAVLSDLKGTDIVWLSPGITDDGTHVLRAGGRITAQIPGRRFPGL